jgi:type II secretory pathway component PulJ
MKLLRPRGAMLSPTLAVIAGALLAVLIWLVHSIWQNEQRIGRSAAQIEEYERQIQAITRELQKPSTPITDPDLIRAR